MSKILFINCYDDMMLALRTMSAQLQQDKHEVFLLALRHLEDCFTPCDPPLMHPLYNQSLQTTQKEVDHVLTVFQEIDPDWVGFSVTSNHIGLFIYLGRLFKEVKPGIRIVWGGADVWFNAEDDIQYADVIVLYEADGIINDLARALDGDISLDSVPGIWHKDKHGNVHKNPPAEPYEDLESIPPGDWTFDRFYEVSHDELFRQSCHPYGLLGQGFRTIMTARGCPFTCSFCCNGYEKDDVPLSRTGRQRSVKHVIDELKHLKKNSPGLGLIYFSDEVFPMNRRWVEEFADAYRSEIDLPFSCYAYPTTVKPWLAKALNRMGECYVQMGVQSGSDRLNREVFHRFATQEDAIKAGRIFADNGILYSVDLIGYNPFELEEDYRSTLNLILRMPRPFIFQSIYQLMFWKNFPIADKAFERGFPLIQTNEHTWIAPTVKEYTYWHALMVIAGTCQSMSPELAQTFVENPAYRDNPHLLMELMQQLQLMNYTRTSTGNWQYKDKHIRDLENYYLRMEGSRAVRGYFQAKNRVKGIVNVGARMTRSLFEWPSKLVQPTPAEDPHAEIKSIFAEHHADTLARKQQQRDSIEAPAPLAKAKGIVGTHGTNGTSKGSIETRKKFQYPKAVQVRSRKTQPNDVSSGK